MKRESLKAVQKSQVSDGGYSKAWFIKLIQDNLTQDQFDRMCREIMYLNEHYDSTIGLNVNDDPNAHLLDPNNFQLQEIDFDAPVNFKRKK